MAPISRRDFIEAGATSAAVLGLPRFGAGADDPLAAIRVEVEKRHDESLAR
jgi:hypothetical protein